MFKVKNITTGSFKNALPIIKVDKNISALPLLKLTNNDYKKNEIVVENVVVSIPLNPSSTYTINIPSVEKVVSVLIGNKYYQRINDGLDLIEGSFKFNKYSNSITFKTYSQIDKVINNLVINYIPLNSNNINEARKVIRNNELQFNIDTDIENIKGYITGEFSVSRQINQPPTSSLNLILDTEALEQIEELIKPKALDEGESKYITLLGIKFSIVSYTKEVLLPSTRPYGEYKISIELEEYYQKELNKLQAFNSNYNSVLSFSNICNQKGIPFIGRDFFIKFTSIIKKRYITTLSSEIDKAISSFGWYLVYTKNGIRLNSWLIEEGLNNNNLSPIKLREEDIISNLNIRHNPRVYFEPALLDWNRSKPFEDTSKDIIFSNAESNSGTKNQKLIKESFLPPKEKIVINNPEASQCPSNLTILKTLEHNFDGSGEREIKEELTYLGSTLVKKITTIYGLAYTASDIINVSTGKLEGIASSYWQIIEQTTEDYLYDQDTGYYLGSNKYGWRLARFQIETDSYETYTLTSPLDLVYKNLYLFTKISIEAVERYELRQMRDFYTDLGENDSRFIFWTEIDINGNEIEKGTKNPEFIEPMFISRTFSYYNSFATTPNPDNATLSVTDVKLPDYTTGEIRKTSTEIKILKSKSTTKTSPDNSIFDPQDSSALLDEDSFITTTSNFSAQDSNYKNSLVTKESSTSSGRPSEANKKALNFTVKLVDKAYESLLKQEETNTRYADKKKYLIYSPEYSDLVDETKFNIQNTVSYDVTSYFKAVKTANSQYYANIVLNQDEVSFTTFADIDLEEGKELDIEYGEIKLQTRIKSISTNVVIYDNKLTGITNVSCGIIPNERNKLIIENLGRKPNIYLLDIYKSGLVIGSLDDVNTLMTTSIGRGNF